MKREFMIVSLAVGLVTGAASAAVGRVDLTPVRRCGPHEVVAGTVCLDTYEASVWRVPNPVTKNQSLVRKIHFGIASQADLETGGATQLGTAFSDDYAPARTTARTAPTTSMR